MKLKKKNKRIRFTVCVIDVLLMILTIAFELFLYNKEGHITRCCTIMTVTAILIIYDHKLKDKERIIMHSLWIFVWFINLTCTLFGYLSF